MKQKLTTEEKKELRQERKSWNELIRRAIKKGALIVSLFILLASCATQKCYPSKKSKDYAHIIRVKKVKDGYLVTEQKGFTRTVKLYECWPMLDTL